MKPKILYTTSDASPQSGAFRLLLGTASGIERAGYRTALAFPKEAASISLLTDVEHVRTYFLQLPRARRGQSIRYYARYGLQNIQSIARLIGIIEHEQVSLVHINEILDFYAAFAARMAGVPCVWHVRADLPQTPRLRWLLPRIVVTLANRVIVPSRSVQENMFKNRGVSVDNVKVIHDAVSDPEQLCSRIGEAAIREELGLDKKALVIGLVGKLVEVKGHKTLLQAAPFVLESFPDTYFVIVGGEVDGKHHAKYATELKRLPKELGIEDRVIFTGYRPDVLQVMAACDIVTHCSVYPDPFPGVVLEGMTIGKPVIASNLGGAKEQIEQAISGLLVDPRDSRALANAIIFLLEDPKRREALGQAAVERVRSHFTTEAYIEKLVRLYDSVLED